MTDDLRRDEPQTLVEQMIVHLRTQDNQPYGSTRLCCSMCGRAHPHATGKDDPQYTHETDSYEIYETHPNRCVLKEAP